MSRVEGVVAGLKIPLAIKAIRWWVWKFHQQSKLSSLAKIKRPRDFRERFTY